jgi:hypothetical protein
MEMQKKKPTGAVCLIYTYVCVCVCVCVRARARACVRERESARGVFAPVAAMTDLA